MHAFWTEEPCRVGERVPLAPEEAKHALSVLRLGVGDQVALSDGAGRFAGVITEAAPGRVSVEVTGELPDGEPPIRLSVYPGLPKADKLEFEAQKLTELGAAAIVPVAMERSVVRRDEKGAARQQERLERIVREAAKQCRRARPPKVEAALGWKKAEARFAGHDLLIVPWEEAGGLTMRRLAEERPDAKDIGLVVGPEGGITEAEVRALEALGARVVTLGPRILRTETAVVAAAAQIMTLWGDL